VIKNKERNWESHAATQGWRISDQLFNSWKDAVSNEYGDETFKAPQVKISILTGYNKGKIRNTAVAQYGLSIFWKQETAESPVSKPNSNDSSKQTTSEKK